jgi:hypothetical protein
MEHTCIIKMVIVNYEALHKRQDLLLPMSMDQICIECLPSVKEDHMA